MSEPVKEWKKANLRWMEAVLTSQSEFLAAYRDLVEGAAGTRTHFNTVMKSSLSAWLSLVNSHFLLRDQILGAQLSTLDLQRAWIEKRLEQLKRSAK